MSKNYFYEIVFSRVALIIFVLTVFIIIGVVKQPPVFRAAPDYSVRLALPNGRTILAEVADTSESQIRGLSGRSTLPNNTGMLFVFDEEGYRSFWMPDMQFAVDIIWLDEAYQIVDIVKDVEPAPGRATDDLPRYASESPARYVLEVNAGFSVRHSLARGDKIQLLT